MGGGKFYLFEYLRRVDVWKKAQHIWNITDNITQLMIGMFPEDLHQETPNLAFIKNGWMYTLFHTTLQSKNKVHQKHKCCQCKAAIQNFCQLLSFKLADSLEKRSTLILNNYIHKNLIIKLYKVLPSPNTFTPFQHQTNKQAKTFSYLTNVKPAKPPSSAISHLATETIQLAKKIKNCPPLFSLSLCPPPLSFLRPGLSLLVHRAWCLLVRVSACYC